jgi:hypothetical protein
VEELRVLKIENDIAMEAEMDTSKESRFSAAGR